MKSSVNISVEAFKNAFQRMAERDWDRIYVVIDVHETILEPNYGGVSDQFYPFAKEVLQELSKRKDIILIMWTCSSEKDRNLYDAFFKGHDINFNYINENPEVSEKTTWGDFETKMYANVLMDDKANPFVKDEWEELLNYLKSE